jgi:hypothetical protein
MDNFMLTNNTLQDLVNELQKELSDNPCISVSTNLERNQGKWGMAKLWRVWMKSTGDFMAAHGATMPLMITEKGEHYGTREFSEADAHELFTAQWLGVDAQGLRLSWSKKGRDGMRPADKGERFNALRKHEIWALEKGIVLINPRNSEYFELSKNY